MTASQPPVVTLFMAMSLNGMIARLDGGEDFLATVNWDAFVDFARAAGHLAWGRVTHEKYRHLAVSQMPDVRGIVLTSDRTFEVEQGWAVAASPEEAIDMAAERGAPELVVAGGSRVNAAFAQRRLLDCVVFDVQPVLIGQGIPLFEPSAFDLPLRLRDIATPSATVIQFHYDVVGRAPRVR